VEKLVKKSVQTSLKIQWKKISANIVKNSVEKIGGKSVEKSVKYSVEKSVKDWW
jgi:hypothetical protein